MLYHNNPTKHVTNT